MHDSRVIIERGFTQELKNAGVDAIAGYTRFDSIDALVADPDSFEPALKELGIAAEAVHNGMRKSDIDRILDNCIYGNVKLLYISPERIHSPLAKERIRPFWSTSINQPL